MSTLLLLLLAVPTADPPREVSGIYPHLAFFNDEGECGTGAVVPWAGRLWAVTYAPHMPRGSSDKLYEIDPSLRAAIRPESIGGTPANRMIHKESQQLFIGPYAIDARGQVRVIPYTQMPGRPTGTARHLTDPAGKVYVATMEEGLYEVDVRTLAVRCLYADTNAPAPKGVPLANLPGYHGKGAYSGQGRLVYANNGEYGPDAQRRPDIPSGCLAEWDGRAWTVVRRNQFTDVTGPGGIEGNADPARDPLWSLGWDHRSLILMLLDGGQWHAYRLPKASHCYDGAHGWNTEWPRIRDVGEADLLMTMHGSFWRFPRTFARARSGGIAPRSTYLKVVGDFCRWNGRLVLGCDDTAKSEFLNKRKAKGVLAGPGQSQSNLWFVPPERLDQLGPALGRGAVWLQEDVKAGVPSDPFLFGDFDRRGVHLLHAAGDPRTLTLEVDRAGDGTWTKLREVAVPPEGLWVGFAPEDKGAWVRLVAGRDLPGATAFFHMSNTDRRPAAADPIFDPLARPGDSRMTGGLVRARGDNKRTLHLASLRPGARAGTAGGEDVGLYEMGADLKLRRDNDATAHVWLKKNTAIPTGILSADAASVIFVDDAGRRWRLPRGDAAFDRPGPVGPERIDREVCTERDLFNAGGTFYELPAENAGGFALVRPIATHNRRIHDYCSYRGLLVLTGVADAARDGPHVVRSEDGQAAVWVGAVDDLWRLGKPRGMGGPWLNTPVRAGVPSDPYLMTGYDKKVLRLGNAGREPVRVRVEVDVSGTGLWRPAVTLEAPPGGQVTHAFPEGFGAYWVRCVPSRDGTLTAQLTYE